jgi:citrate lyase subunit beta/citryl-CoA lyase
LTIKLDQGATVSNEPRIIRTLAFVPAHDEDRILRAADMGMDAIGLDLEDLTPGPAKQHARQIFASMAKQIHAKGVLVMARTNGFADSMCEADLEAVTVPELHCLNVPKASSAADVTRFCELLDRAELSHGLPRGAILVRPVIETAQGIRSAYEIAAASRRVAYMGGVAGGFWGDLGATLGVIMSPEATESLFLRSKVLVDVRAAGVPFPIGGGGTVRPDLELVQRFATENKHLGYTGSFTHAHPEVIKVVNDTFTPTPDELAEWSAVLPRLEEARVEGTIVVTIDGKMYDTAGIPRVQAQLDLARRIGLLSS